VFEIGTSQYSTVEVDQQGLGAQQTRISKYAIVSPWLHKGWLMVGPDDFGVHFWVRRSSCKKGQILSNGM